MSHLLSEFHFNALQKKNCWPNSIFSSQNHYNILCLIYLFIYGFFLKFAPCIARTKLIINCSTLKRLRLLCLLMAGLETFKTHQRKLHAHLIETLNEICYCQAFFHNPNFMRPWSYKQFIFPFYRQFFFTTWLLIQFGKQIAHE